MTDATPLASEQITQEDREAAISTVPDDGSHISYMMVDAIERGAGDDWPLVQAFARHRIAALSATPAPGGPGVVRDAAEALLAASDKRALRGRDHVPSMRDEQDARLALRRALDATPAPSDQDASQAQGEVYPTPGFYLNGKYVGYEPINEPGQVAMVGAIFTEGKHTGWLSNHEYRRVLAEKAAPGATAQDGERKWFPHLDFAGEPMQPGQFREPYPMAEEAPTPTIPAGMVADADCRFADCPPGLFRWAGLLCFKSEYSTKPNQPDAYCVDSGEYFWGGTKGDLEERLNLIVTPLAAAPKQAEQQGVEAFKTMRADDVKAAVRAWLDADDATHWGAFEVALDAAVEGVSERDAVVAMLQADAETMRQNATAYSEEAPTDARALHEVAATLAFKAAQIKRGDHLAALNAPTGAVETGEAK